MQKYISKLASGLVAAAFVASLVPAAAFAAPTSTTVVVQEGNSQGWSSSVATGATTSFVFDDTAPKGDGALELTTGADNDSVAHYSKSVTSMPLSDLSQISFETKRISADDMTNGNATLRLTVDLDGSTTDQIMFEPYYNGYSGADGWLTWTIDQTNGKFWSNNDLTYNGKGGVSAGSYDSNFTLADVLADHPTATITGLVFSMGTWNDNQVVEIDNAHVVTSSEDTTYDFDPTIPSCSSDSNSLDTFNLGSVDGQNGWSSTGSYDQEIVKNVYGYDSLGCKSLRISNAVTSGAFGDQTFSYSTSNEAGETSAATSTYSGGTRQNHYDAQFDIASTKNDYQSGLALSVSPDRGDGSRMSYLRFEDSADGVNVFFDDVQGTSSPANFVETQIAGGSAAISALSHTAVHTVKFSIDFADGASNDVVKVYLDGQLAITGTTWENYYRYDPEQAGNGNQVPTIDSLLFRAAGTAVPGNDGNGFLFDNVDISTSMIPTDTGAGSSGHHNRHNGSGSSSNNGNNGNANNTNVGNNGQNNNNGSNGNPTGGQVLGAAAFNFTRDFYVGLSGADVTELQTELIAAGYSIPAGATGYFGPQTQAAVAQWQKEHDVLPSAGYFGPLSRAKYMAEDGFHLLAATSPMAVPGCQAGFAFSPTTGQACK